jgi:hypothetical protein
MGIAEVIAIVGALLGSGACCLNFIGVVLLIITIVYFEIDRRRKREERKPALTPFQCLGGLDGFNFSLRNDGPTRAIKIEEPKYNKKLVGEFKIRADYSYDPKGQQGPFEFSKSTLATGERIIVIFVKATDTRPITYKGEWEVIISYEGDFYKPKPLQVLFEVDTYTETIELISFK